MQKKKLIMNLFAGKLASRFVVLIAGLLVVTLCALVPAGSSAANAEKPADVALAQRLDAVLKRLWPRAA